MLVIRLRVCETLLQSLEDFVLVSRHVHYDYFHLMGKYDEKRFIRSNELPVTLLNWSSYSGRHPGGHKTGAHVQVQRIFRVQGQVVQEAFKCPASERERSCRQ